VQIRDGQPTTALMCDNCSLGFEQAPQVLLAGQTARRRVRVDAVNGRDRQSSNQHIGHRIHLLQPIQSEIAVSSHPPLPGHIHIRSRQHQAHTWTAPATVVI
jgi:hypothetical protein